MTTKTLTICAVAVIAILAAVAIVPIVSEWRAAMERQECAVQLAPGCR